jgi:RND superfamily putative drug exporter
VADVTAALASRKELNYRMATLARFAVSHRRLVVALWVLVLALALGLARGVGSSYYNSVTLPHTEAQRAADLLARRFPAQAGDTDQIVFHSRSGRVTDPAVRARVGRMLVAVSRLPHVTGVLSPYSRTGAAQIAPGASIGFATSASTSAATRFRRALRSA